MDSPSNHAAQRKGNFDDLTGGKKKSTTPGSGNKHQDIDFDTAVNPQRSVSQHQVSAAGKVDGLLGAGSKQMKYNKFDMDFQTNELNQDTVLIEKNDMQHPYKHSDTPTMIIDQDRPDSSAESVLTFDEHMWDHLPEIQHHSQQGSKLLKEFAVFCKSYSNAVMKFGAEVRKAHEQFQRQLTQ